MNRIAPRSHRLGNSVPSSAPETGEASTSAAIIHYPLSHAALASAPLPSNPFCTRMVRPGAVDYWFGEKQSEDSQAAIMEIVAGLHQHRRGLIVGAHGTGKTTLLHTLRPVLEESFDDIQYVQLSAPGSSQLHVRYRHVRCAAQQLLLRQAQLGRGGLLVVDGAEQLWRVDLWRLLRKAERAGQAVLATSHQQVGGMRILHETKITGALVCALTESLLGDAAPGLQRVVLEELGRREYGRLTNVRDLWFDLYDVAQPHVVPPASSSNLQE